ncbi:MAG: hypothetical protein NVSMB14_08970 [Isosphaeraceae bacterium]
MLRGSLAPEHDSSLYFFDRQISDAIMRRLTDEPFHLLDQR